MNRDVLRFTLSNTTLGDLRVSDPIGWDTTPLVLQRHKEYYGVIETIDQALTFYHEAVDYLNNAIDLGIDTKISVLVETSEDYGVTWETFYAGNISMESIVGIFETTGEYKKQCQIQKTDVWSLFLNRIKTNIDIYSTVDLDGNAVAQPTLLDIILPAQVIRKTLRTEMYIATDDGFVDQIFHFAPVVPVAYGFTVDLPKSIYNEVETKYNYPNGASQAVPPLPVIEAKEPAAAYDFEIALSLSEGGAYVRKIPVAVPNFLCRLQHVSGSVTTNYDLTRADFGTNGIDGHTGFSLTQTINNIKKGDQFNFYIFDSTFSTFDAYIIPNDFYIGFQSYFNVVAHTLPDISVSNFQTKAIKLYDVGNALVKRMTGGANFQSSYFGTGGCGEHYANMKGAHIRGKSFTDSILSLTFADWFADLSKIWNVGIGLESGKVTLEQKSHFFDTSSNSINLSNVRNINRSFRKGIAVNSIEIGYSKWSLSQSGSSLNDPQTQHRYSSPLRLVSAGISLLSRWVAASSLFEITRRAQVKFGETFDTDQDIFVLKYGEGAVHGTLQADVDYVSASDVDDPELMYNKDITPGRNFLQFINLFNIGLDQYVGGVFKFVSGVGNFIASFTLDTDSCTTVATVTENDDIDIGTDKLSGIRQVDFEHPLTWEDYKTIRDNSHKSIGVSETTENHEAFVIEKIEFYRFEKKAKFTLHEAGE